MGMYSNKINVVSLMVSMIMLCVTTEGGFSSENIEAPSCSMFQGPDLLSFVKMYLQNQHFSHIRILNLYNESISNYHVDCWLTWTYYCATSLLNDHKVFVSVVSLSSLLNHVQMDQTEGLILAPLLTDQHVQELQEKISPHRHLMNQHWLVICDETFKYKIRNIYFHLDNNVILAEMSGSSDAFFIVLWDIYQAAQHLPQHIQELTEWGTPLDTSILTKHPSFVSGHNESLELRVFLKPFNREPWHRRNDLTGLTVRCTTLSYPPFTILKKDSGNNIEITGIYGEMWNSLHEQLNFSSVCKEPYDGQWGSEVNGTWVGMLGELVRNESDISVAALLSTYGRNQVVKFLPTLTNEGFVLVIKKSGSSNNWTSYTAVMAPLAWAATIVIMVLMMVQLYLMSKLSPIDDSVDVGEAFLTTVGALAVQGSSIEVKSASIRIIFLLIFIILFLIYTHYTTFLISTLTFKKDVLPFRNLLEMHQSGSHILALEKGTALEDAFKFSKEPLFMSLYADQSILVNSEYEGVDKALSGPYAAFAFKPRMSSTYSKCDFTILPGEFFREQVSWTIQHGSPLYHIFKHQINARIESGMLDKLIKKYLPAPKACGSISTEPLTLGRVMTAFLLLLGGIIICLLILPLEYLYVYLKNNSPKNICYRGEEENFRNAVYPVHITQEFSQNIFCRRKDDTGAVKRSKYRH